MAIKIGVEEYCPQNEHAPGQEPIAIVGMGCRLPGNVTNSADLWAMLTQERTGYRDFPSDRINLDGYYHSNPQRPGTFHTKGAFLLHEDPRLFDHHFFGMSTTQVMSMDPNQRKMLEVAYEAFESAGEPWERFSGSSTGVFIGNMNSDHSIMQTYDIDFALPYTSTGGSTSILSNRVNHVFNLRGPSVTIDTACSSSMYALHAAVSAIRNGDCEAAIVGGCNLITSPEMQVLTTKLGALSATSTCHTFDAAADGYARGEGFGALYLKRYSQARAENYPIRAVIRATAVNSNGRTAGISHPSADGQEGLIRKAYKDACLSPKDTGYFECHGTGTPVGDPLEVVAIGRVFGVDSERVESPLLIGSVKTNLGHSEAASGIAGILKTILALEKGMIPPSIGVKQLNPVIDFDAARVKVVTELTPWPNVLRRASVNSFGYGGANAHCIIEHPSIIMEGEQQRYRQSFLTLSPVSIASLKLERSQGHERIHKAAAKRLTLLPFSAHDPVSLEANISFLEKALSGHCLADIAYTLTLRRSMFLFKAFRIVSASEPSKFQEEPSPVPSIRHAGDISSLGFIFTGQGAQWQGMGRQLLEYREFRESIRRQDCVLRHLPNSPLWSLEGLFLGDATVSVNTPDVAQTICTALQCGIVMLLRAWNVNATTCIGHSSGEIAAAFASGCISEAEAIVIAFCRGRALAHNARDGAMLAVGLPPDEAARRLINESCRVQVAAINAPKSSTLSGDAEAIQKISSEMQAEGIFVRELSTGGNAYHSHHMLDIVGHYDRALDECFARLAGTDLLISSPRMTGAEWISSVDPNLSITGRELRKGYWTSNLVKPVQFSGAVQTMLTSKRHPTRALVEIGPHSALRNPLKQIFEEAQAEPPVCLSALQRNQDGMSNILTLCGDLFVLGYPIDLVAVNSIDFNESVEKPTLSPSVCVDLPPYRYNYGPPIYHENRIFRDIRERKYVRHDLLGVVQPGRAKEHPSWRNILRVKDVPWLSHHRLAPDAVLPGSAYVALAIEALSQHLDARDENLRGRCFTLRNVSIRSAMQIPEDDIGLEVMLNMHATSHSPNWFNFAVSSVSTKDTWTEHASGTISLHTASGLGVDSLDGEMDVRFVETSDWYEKFSEAGLVYGPAFQGMSNLRTDPTQNLATADVMLDTTSNMFDGPESRYTVHPAPLDVCNQLGIIALHGGHTERFKQAFIPTFIEEMTVWPSVMEVPSAKAVAQAQFKGLRGAHAEIQLFAPSGEPIVAISTIRSVTYAGGEGSMGALKVRTPYTRLAWKPDISTLDNSQAKALFPPRCDEDFIRDVFVSMDTAAAYMIAHIAQVYGLHDAIEPSQRRLLTWAKRSASTDRADIRTALDMTSEARISAIEQICCSLESVVDVQHTKRVFDNLPDILSGKVTGVEVAMRDNLLNEVYTSGLGISAAYPQLSHLADLLGHRDPSMKILEIGGGTGGATHHALRALCGDTKRYSEYVFTDVSSGFLETARAKFAAYKGLSYRTLDIEQCPWEQGFGAEYDLVIASECLHATSDIVASLQNARKLLKNGGRMIIIETTRTLLGHGLAYGTFPGYWPKDDAVDSPFVSEQVWNDGLLASGFSGIDIALDDYPPPLSLVTTVMTTALDYGLAESTELRAVTNAGLVHLVYLNAKGHIHEALARELSHNNVTAVFTALGEQCIPEGSRVIFTADVEGHLMLDEDESTFNSLKSLVARCSSILWLTRGDMLRGSNPKAAVATGLIRMLTTEDALSRYGIMHLEQDCDLNNRDLMRHIVEREAKLNAGDFEREIAMQDNVPYISRLLLDDSANARYRDMYGRTPSIQASTLQSLGPVIADFTTPGLLSSLYFRTDEDHYAPLPGDWIEVKVGAISLNWKDIAVASGHLGMKHSSSECAGTVTKCGRAVSNVRPGDRVFALAWGNFGTHVRLPACQAQHFSSKCSFVEAATMPLVFCTAVYAFVHVGRLQKGENVLIQSATGGLGLAAIQLAKHLGADVYATAGTEEKMRHLSEVCGIPRERIFSSRHPSDIAKMTTATRGQGFDVILSSSSGDMMHDTWRCIAPRGRFVDVGRVDVQNNSYVALEMFNRNATFTSFDLSTMAVQSPEFCGTLMQEVKGLMDQGAIGPITPYKHFEISQLDKALLYLSQGKHVGKVVVDFEKELAIVKAQPSLPKARFDGEAVYILVGGLGGLGRSILAWMAERGARTLYILTRSEERSAEATMLLKRLSSRGVLVCTYPCDVTNRDDVVGAIRDAATRGPVKGILHAAVVLQDRVFSTLTHGQWQLGLAAKVQGTLNLHYASLAQPLDFFIMTSSFESVLALPTQAAYCAANSFQDAFSRYRRSIGLPGCAIAFGLITEIGEMGQRNKTRKMISRNGMYRTGELGFLRLLEAAFLDPLPNADASWRVFDPLADAQFTTCLEPGELAKMMGKAYDAETQVPRWHTDKKFSHLLQATNDCLLTDHVDAMPAEAAKPVVTAAVDAAIQIGETEEAVQMTVHAIIERVAALLFLPREKIEPQRSVAHYGVDSLIAVELRNWIAAMFMDTLPLLMLLDESISIQQLGRLAVEKRRALIES